MRIFRHGRSVTAATALPPPTRSPSMSLHDIFIRMATIDDDDTARVIAVALNADAEIRRIAGGGAGHWTALDIQRVARMLAEHAGVSKISPRSAAHNAIAKAFEDELPFTQEERS
jgi:hypothetical protein